MSLAVVFAVVGLVLMWGSLLWGVLLAPGGRHNRAILLMFLGAAIAVASTVLGGW